MYLFLFCYIIVYVFVCFFILICFYIFIQPLFDHLFIYILVFMFIYIFQFSKCRLFISMSFYIFIDLIKHIAIYLYIETGIRTMLTSSKQRSQSASLRDKAREVFHKKTVNAQLPVSTKAYSAFTGLRDTHYSSPDRNRRVTYIKTTANQRCVYEHNKLLLSLLYIVQMFIYLYCYLLQLYQKIINMSNSSFGFRRNLLVWFGCWRGLRSNLSIAPTRRPIITQPMAREAIFTKN